MLLYKIIHKMSLRKQRFQSVSPMRIITQLAEHSKHNSGMSAMISVDDWTFFKNKLKFCNIQRVLLRFFFGITRPTFSEVLDPTSLTFSNFRSSRFLFRSFFSCLRMILTRSAFFLRFSLFIRRAIVILGRLFAGFRWM